MSALVRVALTAVALVLGTALGLLAGFRGPALGPDTVGDADLAADVRASLTTDRGLQSLSVARVRDGRVTFVGLGGADGGPPSPTTPYELGSITKTFTAALLADAVGRGEVTLDDPVSTHLPELAGTEVGESTLRALATHTAGLPAFPQASAPLVAVRVVGNANPYGGSVADLLAAARGTAVTDPGTYRYSNLGVALLGHALARAAGSPDWSTLLHVRLLGPLGMRSTLITTRASDVPAGTARPHHENGWPAPFWTGPAFAPAGSSTVTTAADLATWARALLDGTAPGAAALDAVADIPGGRIGLLWHVREVDGRTITWHNGATGGTRTMLALDRERREAVLVLGNAARDVDTGTLRLAATAPGAPVAAVDTPGVGWAGLAGWNAVGLLLLGTAVLRFRVRRPWAIVDGALAGATGLLLVLAHGPWLAVWPALWSGLLLATLTAVALALGAPRPARNPGRVSTVVSLGTTTAVLALTLWSL